MKRLGKRGREWENARRKLKQQFFNNGITRCEMCSSDFGLSFAHRLKRRHIQTEDELKTVALLCIKCHEKVERGNSETMYLTITEIIEKREQI